MKRNSYDYRTPASLLVEVAKIAAPFRGQRDQLNLVCTEVKKITPVFSHDVVNVIAREMGLTMIDVYNFITFYSMLTTRPHGKYTVRICRNAPCHINGAAEVVRAVEDQLGVKMGETTEDGRFTLEYCPCLGMCEVAPAVMINQKVYTNLTPDSIRSILKAYIREEVDDE